MILRLFLDFLTRSRSAVKSFCNLVCPRSEVDVPAPTGRRLSQFLLTFESNCVAVTEQQGSRDMRLPELCFATRFCEVRVVPPIQLSREKRQFVDGYSI